MQINDPHGILDPTNPSGPHVGHIEPLLQAQIRCWNPTLSEWQSRFRGWVSDWDYDFDPSQQTNRLTLQLTDIFELLGAIEMLPGYFGDDPTTATPPRSDAKGQVWFDADSTVKARIDQALANAFNSGTYPDRLNYSVVFSGNVSLVPTTYSPGETPLDVIFDAADAEFPGVSNVYTDRFGRIVFHGRYAKFNPSGVLASFNWSATKAYVLGDYVNLSGVWYRCILAHTNQLPPNPTYWTPDLAQWDWHHWRAGDRAAVTADLGNVAQLRQFAFNRGLSKIINSALSSPQWVRKADTSTAGYHYEQYTDDQNSAQIVQDTGSIGSRGIRSWSAQNLQTDVGLVDNSTSLVETKRFASYYTANYSTPRNRPTQVGFRSMPTGSPGEAVTWLLLTRVDISDRIDITVASPGGGGFNGASADAQFYVEGVHETVEPANPDVDNVTVTLDLSPLTYFSTNPFPIP